jgi:hypothetical protein
MKGLLVGLISFYKWQTETPFERFIEVLVKIWVTGLFLIAVGGWLTIVISTILNPSIWDGVQFGIYDTLGT